MNKKTEHELIISLINKIGPVDMNLVIGEVVHGGKHLIQLNGKRAEDNEALALKKEAELVVQTRLWKVFTETLRYQAQRRMFVEAKTVEDMNWGKALLHSIGVLENLIVACSNPLLLADQSTVHRPSLDKKPVLKDNQIK